jgi:hypothetical protein
MLLQSSPLPAAMTPEAQRIACAESQGWERTTDWRSGWMLRTPEWPKGMPGDLPNYDDLNVLRELEKTLDDETWKKFDAWLADIAYRAIKDTKPLPKYFRKCSASAAQRLEAYLRCKNLWQDSKPEMK